MAREKLYQKVRVIPEYWTEKQNDFRRVAASRGVQYEPKPVKVHWIGNVFLFNPECELEENQARRISHRWYIELVGEPYYKPVEGELPTDAKDEDDQKYGEAYLCKHCGWPYPKRASRTTHERRWCERKDDK